MILVISVFISAMQKFCIGRILRCGNFYLVGGCIQLFLVTTLCPFGFLGWKCGVFLFVIKVEHSYGLRLWFLWMGDLFHLVLVLFVVSVLVLGA